MKLSEHFELAEFIRSDKARELGDPNEPGPEHLENLKEVARRLEAVRALFNLPITIESGYRNPRVNAAVGGVVNSDHALGWAVDIQINGVSDLEVCKRIRDSAIEFHQLIREDGRTVHLSFHPKNRRECLRQPGGPGTTCFPGFE